MRGITIVFLLVTAAGAARAELRLPSDVPVLEAPTPGMTWNPRDSAPNELYPQDLVGLAGRPPDRAFVDIAVGTDRGWILAAVRAKQSPHSHLALVDRDPGAVLFNRMNRELIRGSRSAEEYRFLRITAEATPWRERVAAMEREGRIDATQARMLTTHFAFWQSTIRLPRTENLIATYTHLHPRPTGEPGEPFHGVNYLWDESLFGALQRIVKADRVAVTQVNLRFDHYLPRENRQRYEELLRMIADRGLRVGIVDFSNAHWGGYISPVRVVDALDRFRSDGRLTGESRLLLTGILQRNEADGRPQGFAYTGYLLSALLAEVPGEKPEARVERIAGEFPGMFIHELYNRLYGAPRTCAEATGMLR